MDRYGQKSDLNEDVRKILSNTYEIMYKEQHMNTENAVDTRNSQKVIYKMENESTKFYVFSMRILENILICSHLTMLNPKFLIQEKCQIRHLCKPIKSLLEFLHPMENNEIVEYFNEKRVKKGFSNILFYLSMLALYF